MLYRYTLPYIYLYMCPYKPTKKEEGELILLNRLLNLVCSNRVNRMVRQPFVCRCKNTLNVCACVCLSDDYESVSAKMQRDGYIVKRYYYGFRSQSQIQQHCKLYVSKKRTNRAIPLFP